MKCLNSFNEFYFNQFNRLVSECRERNNTNLLNNYRRVCASIQKYPFPILSTQQALTMDGIGEATSRTFEKFIRMYQKKISDEAIDYVKLAYEINDPKTKKNKKGKKLKPESESGTDTKNFIKKKPLKNVESFSANWTAGLSLYLVHLQDKSLKIQLDDALQMAQALLEELGSSGIKIQKCALKNVKELKDCAMVDSIEEKSSGVFININEFLIKWAKLETKKHKIEVDVDEEGTLSFQINVESNFDIEENKNNFESVLNNNLSSNVNNNYYSNLNSKSKSTDLNNLILSNKNKNIVSSRGNDFLNNKKFDSQVSVNSLVKEIYGNSMNLNNVANTNTNTNLIKSLVKNSNLDNFLSKSKANNSSNTNFKLNNLNSGASNLKENISNEDRDNSEIEFDARARSPFKSTPNNFNLKKTYKNETEEHDITEKKNIKNNFNNKNNSNNNNSKGNDFLDNLNYLYQNCDFNYNDFDFNTECSGYEASHSQDVASKPKSFNNLENLGSKYAHLFNTNNNNLNCIYEDSESKNNITYSNIDAVNEDKNSNSIIKNFDEQFKKNYEHLNNLIESSRKNSSVVDLSTLKKNKKNKHCHANAGSCASGNSNCTSAQKAFGQNDYMDYEYVNNNFDSNNNMDHYYEGNSKFNFESAEKQVKTNAYLSKEEKIKNFINNYNPNLYSNTQNNKINSNTQNSSCNVDINKHTNNLNLNKNEKSIKNNVNNNNFNRTQIPEIKLNTEFQSQNNLEKSESIEKSSDELFRGYRKFLNSLKNSSLSFSSNNSKNFNNICETEDFESFALNIKLLIDNRERGPKGEKLTDEIRCVNPELQCEERVLAVGDFMWIYCDPHTETEYCLDFIIERKTLGDLASSIKDGRYVEQKHRLKNTKINNVFYLFEGNSFNSAYNSVPKSAVFTAILNTFNIHDIGVIKTGTFEESLERIDTMDCFIRNFYYTRKETLDLFEMETFQDFMIKNAKTKNLSEENIFLKQLRCFDDCGAKSVEILKKTFKSPLHFYRLLQRIDDEDKKANLIDCMIYLAESNLDLSDKNILYQLEPQNFRKIKKDLKSIKKIRKNTNAAIIEFYS